jgi:TorA maturation chaperone TorD
LRAVQDYNAQLIATATIYNLLASSLTGDGEKLMAVMTSLRKLFENLSMAAEMELVNEIVKILDEDERATSEFVRLFEMGVVPPSETSYTCRESPSLKTFELADIAGFYKAFNLKPSYGTPDHLGAEMEFMAYLLVREALAESAGQHETVTICRDAREKFYREHLSVWVEDMAKQVGEKAEKPLYKHVTKLFSHVIAKGVPIR